MVVAQKQGSTPAEFGQMYVLVVDRDVGLAAGLKQAFDSNGPTEFDVVGSRETALQAIDARAPGLVIVNLDLAGLDGFQLCRAIRNRPHVGSVPIIAVISRANEADRVRALDAGADDCLTKPFGLKELAARTRAVMRRRAANAGVFGSFRSHGSLRAVAKTRRHHHRDPCGNRGNPRGGDRCRGVLHRRGASRWDLRNQVRTGWLQDRLVYNPSSRGYALFDGTGIGGRGNIAETLRKLRGKRAGCRFLVDQE